MPLVKSDKLRSVFKWVLWVLLVQFILMNISAASYAYRFTHFYEGPPVTSSGDNVFSHTWHLFTGPKIYKQTTGQQPAFPFEAIQLKTSDGHTLGGWYSTVDGAKGCVILLHGIMVNKSYLLNEAGALRQAGYNVLLFDFRAHGSSSGLATTFGVDETDEVEQAFRYARQRGNKKIVLYGSSLGAVVAFKATADGKVAPDGIIAEMPFASLKHHLKARARVLGFPGQPFVSLVTFWVGVERGYNGFKHCTGTYSAKLKCPVLLQWGKKDPYVLGDEISGIEESIGGPKKFVVYETAGHESLLLMDPSKWMDETGRFLQSLP